MSPTQAREVIEAAAERIAEWEDRLRITNGDGVEVWDSPNGQMVAVAPAGAPAPFEPMKEDWNWFLFVRQITIFNGSSSAWSPWQRAGSTVRAAGGRYDGLFVPFPGYPRSTFLVPNYISPDFGLGVASSEEVLLEFQSRTITPAEFQRGLDVNSGNLGMLDSWLLANTSSGRRATIHFEIYGGPDAPSFTPFVNSFDFVLPSGVSRQYYQPAFLPGTYYLRVQRISGLW